MIDQLVSSRTKLVTAIVTTSLVTMPALFAQAANAAPVKKTLLQKWVIDGGSTMLFIGVAIGLHCTYRLQFHEPHEVEVLS